MKTLFRIFVIWMIATMLHPGATAQTDDKIPIGLICKCDQMIAAQYASKLRDLLAISPRYKEQKDAKNYRGWKINVVTASVQPGDANYPVIAISSVLTLGDFYIAQEITICGQDQVDHCAAITLANADSDIQATPFK